MLNILPPSVTPVLSSPPILRRRRGGQPSNRNALNHGLYAAKNHTPLTDISSSIPIHSQVPGKSPDVITRAIQVLREEIDLAYQFFVKAENFRTRLAWFNLIVKSVGLVSRLGTALYLQQQPLRDLYQVSHHGHSLIRYGFRHDGITRDADSFREKIEKSDFNSPVFQGSLCASLSEPSYPFISLRQWAVLEPLLPPSDHTGRRGRPPSDPRELLDAIFWKLAHHARWLDLPIGYPPMLSCRRYYRRLFLSGRLATLYSALYNDFRAQGYADLAVFVKQGCFKITGTRVTLLADLDAAWHMRTALLFLQQGFQVLRNIRREQAQERRRKSPTLRMMLKRKSLQNPSLLQKEEFSYTPITLDNLGPGNHRKSR